MLKFIRERRRLLQIVVICLLVLLAVTFPFSAGLTYAEPGGSSPDHVLTYIPGRRLFWDDDTVVDSNGVGQLSLFSSAYTNVASNTGGRVVAPGTDSYDVISLKNDCRRKVDYIAIVYRIKSSDLIPVETTITGEGFEFASYTFYPDDDHIALKDILYTVKGSLEPYTSQDFQINWLWNIGSSEEEDKIDTMLGNMSANGRKMDVTIGMHFVVIDKGSVITPTPPGTRDNAVMGLYIVLMTITITFILLLFFDKRREEKKKENL